MSSDLTGTQAWLASAARGRTVILGGSTDDLVPGAGSASVDVLPHNLATVLESAQPARRYETALVPDLDTFDGATVLGVGLRFVREGGQFAIDAGAPVGALIDVVQSLVRSFDLTSLEQHDGRTRIVARRPERDEDEREGGAEVGAATYATTALAAERLRLSRARATINDYKAQIAELRWRLAVIQSRRWWRVGMVLQGVLKNPREVARLPKRLLAIAVGPSRRPPDLARLRAGDAGEGPDAVSLSLNLPVQPLPVGPVNRPNLTVACILDPFSELAFRYEFRCVYPTPANFADVVAREQPALLFVESAWRGNRGAWNYHMSASDAPKPALVELVELCRERGIPTVFWNKEDPPNFEVFLSTARLFDQVFTVDEDCIPRYREALGHEAVGLLPFAAQPRIHNPVMLQAEREHEVAFAGTYFAEKHPARRQQMEFVLDPARQFDLHIFSRMGDADPRYRYPERFEAHVVGSLPYESMLTAYKAYKVFLNVNSVTDSPSMCARRIFELSACATPVLSGPARSIAQFFPDGEISVTSSPDETERLLGGLLSSKELRDRTALRAMRRVFDGNTFSDRVDTVLDAVGIKVRAAPTTVSAIIPTNRPEALDKIAENLARQSGVNLQPIVVLHGSPHSAEEVRRRLRDAGLDGAIVLEAAESLNLGQVMNVGVDAADGAYIAKMDDDNFYGSNYLHDLLNVFAYADAGVTGKWAHYAYLSATDATILRFPHAEHRYTRLVQGGTIVGRADLVRFAELPRGIDTAFLRKCERDGVPVYSADRFNYVSVRSHDPSDHTWTIKDDELLSKAEVQFYGRADGHVDI